MSNFYRCRQIVDSKVPTEDDWTENWSINAADEAEAAEKFCDLYILDGDAPYQVEVQHQDQEVTFSSWTVEKIFKPVFKAKKESAIERLIRRNGGPPASSPELVEEAVAFQKTEESKNVTEIVKQLVEDVKDLED